MAFAALPALGAVGAGVSAIGTIEGGEATSAADSYQAQVARNNATIAQQNAVYSEQAGGAQAQAESLKGAAQGGLLKASQAANGIDVNSGSAVDVQTSQHDQAQLDTQTTANNAALKAYGYRTEATSDTAQAGLDQAAANQAPIGAALGAAGGLLGSVSSIGMKWTGQGGSGGSGGSGGNSSNPFWLSSTL